MAVPCYLAILPTSPNGRTKTCDTHTGRRAADKLTHPIEKGPSSLYGLSPVPSHGADALLIVVFFRRKVRASRIETLPRQNSHVYEMLTAFE